MNNATLLIIGTNTIKRNYKKRQLNKAWIKAWLSWDPSILSEPIEKGTQIGAWPSWNPLTLPKHLKGKETTNTYKKGKDENLGTKLQQKAQKK